MKHYQALSTITVSLLGLSLMMGVAHADTYFYNTPSTEDTHSTVTDTSSHSLNASTPLSPSRDSHDQFVQRYQVSNS